MSTYSFTKKGTKMLAVIGSTKIYTSFAPTVRKTGEFLEIVLDNKIIGINPAIDTVSIDGTTYNPNSRTAEQMFSIMSDSQAFTVASTGASTSLLPIDSRIVYVGDSITAHQINATQKFYFGDAFPTWAQLHSGHKLFQPIGGNLGVAGETTTQILSRFAAVVALNPKVIVLLAGTNDVTQSVAEATIKNNLKTMYREGKHIGAKIIAITIPPRFAPAAALSSANETIRQNVNAWIKTVPEIDAVVDCEAALSSAMYFADGLHPNTLGDSILGALVAEKINSLTTSVPANLVNTGYQVNPRAVNNPLLIGGATAATNWNTQNYLGGATLTLSKEVVNGEDKQIITLSGNYTGNGMGFQFKQDFNSSGGYVAGDILEGIIDFEVLEPLTNIIGIAPEFTVYTASFGSTLADAYGYYPTSTDVMPLPVGRYVIKTPPRTIAAGTPAIITNLIKFYFKDAAASTPIAGKIRLHRIGTRKVNGL